MALLMVHLLVAQRWAVAHEALRNSPEFWLGVISPDAIHVRDKDDKSHKNEIHLDNWMRPHPETVIEYWRAHPAPFDIGYGVHVLTDGQWVPRFRSRLPELILPDGKLDTAVYYNDTYVTDFALYRDRDGATLFDRVDRAAAPKDHPLLTEYEIDEWRRRIVESYRGPCPKHGPVRFINVEYVESFIDDSVKLIEETYRRYCNE